jgi:Helicase associated domain
MANLRVSRKGSSLGDWCGTQRIRYKQGKLSLERIAKLEAICFPWDAREELWDKNYADLVAYKRIHGHCNVPTESGSLGSWCNSQRQRRNSLSAEQIAQLDTLNLCWGITAAAWNKNYAELVAYKEAHGHCNVPKESGSLGRWCHNQRHRRSQSTPDRIAKLDALGFCWQFTSRTVPELNMAFPPVDLVNPAEGGLNARHRVAASTETLCHKFKETSPNPS